MHFPLISTVLGHSAVHSRCSLKGSALSCALLTLWGLIPLSAAVNAAQLYSKDGSEFAVFGRVQAAFVNDAAYQEMARDTESSDHTLYASARLGLAARSAITHGLDAIAMAEWETSGYEEQEHQDGPLNHTRYLFTGLDAYQYGTLIVGRGDGAYYTIAGATDIFNVMQGHASDYYLLGDQRPAQIMYSLRALSWDLKLSYMFATNALGNTPLETKRGMGASISTKFGENVTFAYGIDYTDFRYAANRSQSEEFFAPMLMQDGLSYEEALHKSRAQHIGNKVEYGAALSYGVLGQGLYASLVVSSTDYAYLNHQLYTIDTAAKYSFANGLGLAMGYGFKGYDGHAVISELTLGIDYQFNANFKLFAEAQFDLDSDAYEFYGKTIARELNLGEDKYVLGAEFSF